MAELAALPPVVRLHLQRLTGRHGIYQHAIGPAPDPGHGTCTDDVARALAVDVLHAPQLGWLAVAPTTERSLAYLEAAFEAGSGRFRNFRADDGSWLDGPASQDAHGRAMLALAMTAASDAPVAGRAATLYGRGLPAAGALTAHRAVASSILGCAAATGPEADGLPTATRGQAAAGLERLAWRLGAAFRPATGGTGRARRSWPWPEPTVTYEAFLLPRALLAAGDRLGRDDLTTVGCRVLDWLLDELVDGSGGFHPVGNRGWWRFDDRAATGEPPKGRPARGRPGRGRPARFDQQPIEASALVATAELAHRLTGDSSYAAAAEAGYAWYTGTNDLGVSVALPDQGACQDGLGPKGVNANQGAESTLAWLAAVEHMRALRAHTGRPETDQRMGSSKPWGSGRGQDRTYARTDS
jgi:hypothetical protein